MNRSLSLLNLNSFTKKCDCFIVFLFLVSLNFGCTGKSNDKYPSPFADEKIRLSEEFFKASKTEMVSGKSVNVIKSSPLMVVLNNQCLEQNCKEGLSEDSISCGLYQTQYDERLKNTQQYYTYTPPLLQSADEAKAHFLKNNVDHKCVVGVTEIQNYETQDLNDTFYNNQKNYLDMIQYEASRSHFASTDLEMVKVAIIDSGIGTSTDLPTVVANEDFRSNPNPASCSSAPAYSAATPQHYHGSFVAGIVAANSNNNNGIAGIANNVSLYSYNVGNCLGQISNVDVGNAILRAIGTHNVEIINMSLGGKMPDDVGLRNAIVQGLNKDVFFVLAAGNSLPGELPVDVNSSPANSYYPAGYAADYPGVISVAALATSTTLASFSNYSAKNVSIAAPGVNIASTNGNASFRQATVPLSGGYGVDSGTSFAAPIVTGAMALTIGRLKKLSFGYDTAFLRRMLLEAGSDQIVALETKVKSGAVLNLLKLGQALTALETGGTSRSLTINMNIIGSGADVVIELMVDWDLIATNPGARLGLFDSGGNCNFSEPCLIQDFELTKLKGQQIIRLTRSELMTLVPDLRDPNYKLNITVAVYYKVPKFDLYTGEFEGYKNNYGLNAQASIDLRTINLSDSSSNILGAITNIRKDMSHFYVKGWACYQGDNQAVSVRLLDNLNNPVPTKSSYIYPYMVSHGTPIDSDESWSESGFDINTRVLKPSLANGIQRVFGPASVSKSGIEATPKIIDLCRTLTAAHGFELMVPLSQVKLLNQGLAKIEASFASKTLILKDAQNRSSFNFPEVLGLSSSINSFSLTRGDQNFTSTGSLCSDSPAPIEVEVSFNHAAFLFAMFDNTGNMGDNNITTGFVHIPSFGASTSIRVFDKSKTNDTAVQIQTLSLSSYGPAFLEFYNSLPAFKPNAYFYSSDNPTYINSVNSYDLRRVSTGEPFTMFDENTKVVVIDDLLLTKQNESRTLASNSGVVPSGLSRFWDYYDVGESFSLSYVGYSLNLTSKVGKWINDTYKIKSVLREIKKYETPLTTNANVLSRDHLLRNGTCGSSFKHDFNLTINDYIKYKPNVGKRIKGFWIDPQNPRVLDRDEIANAMKKVPLTYRFYQDGKLIKHIVTDFGQTFTEIDYNF